MPAVTLHLKANSRGSWANVCAFEPAQLANVKEECDKEAMKNLPLETLHAVGAALKQEDAFGYEVKRELIQEVA